MKIYTAKYKAEQPANKELHVPTNSKYGVGLQFERDGQPWDLLPDEVTLDGLSADDVVDGTFIFERTSGEYDQKVSDVRAADMGVHVSADNVLSTNNARPAIVAFNLYKMNLSAMISEPVDVTVDQLKAYSRFGITEEAMLSSEFMSWNAATNINHKIYYEGVGSGKPFAVVSIEQKKFWLYASITSGKFAEVDDITLTPDSVIIGTQQLAPRKTACGELSVTIDTADTVRNYKLTETTEDQGIVLGFNEKYVLKDTIELSGTNDDDTTFSYTLPITD